ncbi:MAG: hypothetical protein KBG84_09975 [Planctomycetes bacterium]|nr:hypothetical protein [Planctomycetota bacterium]
MTWLELPALGLMLSLAVLAWLVFMQRGARRIEVGTLFIWRKVVARADARKRQARMEPLIWLCAGALAVAAIGAARPAVVQAQGGFTVAVYVERLAAEGAEPDATEVLARAREAAPDAQLKFFAAAPTGHPEIDGALTQLAPGAIADELAQFRARSSDAGARLMFVCEPEESAGQFGLALPRVLSKRDGVVFGVNLRGSRMFVRSSGFGPPEIKGAALRGARSGNGETTREYEATASEVEISTLHSPRIVLRKADAVRVRAQGGWNGDVHRALLAALVSDSNYQQAETGEVGLDVDAPRRIEITRGNPADLKGASVNFDSQHALFAQLPLSAFDWIADGRVLTPAEGERVLLAAQRDGNSLGALILLSADGRALRFAGDPFGRAPVAAAALLLDNALGVLMGERPSEAARYRVVSGDKLPSERAAFAAPFEPQGSLDVSSALPGALHEITPWLALCAAVLALGAAWMTR